jgi:hypothetical protein
MRRLWGTPPRKSNPSISSWRVSARRGRTGPFGPRIGQSSKQRGGVVVRTPHPGRAPSTKMVRSRAMADRQRTPVAAADGIPRRLSGQTSANASAPPQGVAKRKGKRVAIRFPGEGAGSFRGGNAPLIGRVARGGRALRNPDHLRAQPPPPQAGSKTDEATITPPGSIAR